MATLRPSAVSAALPTERQFKRRRRRSSRARSEPNMSEPARTRVQRVEGRGADGGRGGERAKLQTNRFQSAQTGGARGGDGCQCQFRCRYTSRRGCEHGRGHGCRSECECGCSCTEHHSRSYSKVDGQTAASRRRTFNGETGWRASFACKQAAQTLPLLLMLLLMLLTQLRPLSTAPEVMYAREDATSGNVRNAPPVRRDVPSYPTGLTGSTSPTSPTSSAAMTQPPAMINGQVRVAHNRSALVPDKQISQSTGAFVSRTRRQPNERLEGAENLVPRENSISIVMNNNSSNINSNNGFNGSQRVSGPKNEKELKRLRELAQKFETNQAINDKAYYSLLAVYSLFILFGTLSNSIICLTVILKPKILSPRNIFIVNLASSDLLLCVFTMPLTFIELSVKMWQMGVLPCKLVAGLQATSIFVSTISITAIAVDRYMVIVYPTHQETANGPKGAALLLGCIWLVALLLSLPLFCFRTVKHVEPPERSVSFGSIDFCVEDWPLDHGRGIFSVISMTLQYVLPITIVSSVYVRISDKLHKRLIRRQRITQLECQQKRQLNLIKRTHKLLISVSLIFGLSWLPLNLINVLCDFTDLFKQEDQKFRVVFAICHLIGCSSACTNPILYGYLNENFRKEVQQVYRHYAHRLARACACLCCTRSSLASLAGTEVARLPVDCAQLNDLDDYESGSGQSGCSQDSRETDDHSRVSSSARSSQADLATPDSRSCEDSSVLNTPARRSSNGQQVGVGSGGANARSTAEGQTDLGSRKFSLQLVADEQASGVGKSVRFCLCLSGVSSCDTLADRPTSIAQAQRPIEMRERHRTSLSAGNRSQNAKRARRARRKWPPGGRRKLAARSVCECQCHSRATSPASRSTTNKRRRLSASTEAAPATTTQTGGVGGSPSAICRERRKSAQANANSHPDWPPEAAERSGMRVWLRCFPARDSYKRVNGVQVERAVVEVINGTDKLPHCSKCRHSRMPAGGRRRRQQRCFDESSVNEHSSSTPFATALARSKANEQPLTAKIQVDAPADELSAPSASRTTNSVCYLSVEGARGRRATQMSMNECSTSLVVLNTDDEDATDEDPQVDQPGLDERQPEKQQTERSSKTSSACADCDLHAGRMPDGPMETADDNLTVEQQPDERPVQKMSRRRWSCRSSSLSAGCSRSARMSVSNSSSSGASVASSCVPSSITYGDVSASASCCCSSSGCSCQTVPIQNTLCATTVADTDTVNGNDIDVDRKQSNVTETGEDLD